MANSKSKSNPHLLPKPEREVDPSRRGWTAPDQIVPLDRKLTPIKPRPLLFAITLSMLVGWLLFLAFVAYRVTVS